MLRAVLTIAVFMLLLSETAADIFDTPSGEERSRQFDALARQSEAWNQQGNLIKQVVRLVRPSVVHIEARKSESIVRHGGRNPVEEAGSGVVFAHRSRLYVLTNRHVVYNASSSNITIELTDGRQIHPTRVRTDLGTDVAVMALGEQDIIAARFGDSSRMEIGDFVVAVGSPFGLNHSVTFGIISAKGRRELELGVQGVRFQNFIQTDASINPGNSGGPLFNLRGEVIGINTAIASNSGGNEGIGFAIPVNVALLVAKQLIENDAVKRGYLGVTMDLDYDAAKAAKLGLPRPIGVRITNIAEKSPAKDAMLRVNDVIVRYNDVIIEDSTHLVNLVSLTAVDKEVEIEFYRDGERMTATVTVADRAELDANG